MARKVRNPKRVVARRARNYKAVHRPTIWGNPYRVEEFGRDRAMALYARWLARQLAADPEFLEPLRGYDLGCTCAPGLACHADVILRKLYG
jgi:hypothetical protein